MRYESVSNSRTWHDVRCHSEAQITMESSLGFLDSQFWDKPTWPNYGLLCLGFPNVFWQHHINIKSFRPTQRICHSATELRGVLTKSFWPGMKPQFVQEIPGTMQHPPVTPAASSGSDFFWANRWLIQKLDANTANNDQVHHFQVYNNMTIIKHINHIINISKCIIVWSTSYVYSTLWLPMTIGPY